MDYFVLRFDQGYEKDDYLALQRLYQKKLQPWWKHILEVLMLLAGVIVVIDAILLLTLGSIGQGLFSLALGLLLAMIFLFRTRINAWASRRQAMKTENLTVKFSAEGITETSSTGTLTMPYSNVERIFHYRACYFLFLDKRHAHILPESHFAVGDPADFAAFIEDRTRLRVEHV